MGLSNNRTIHRRIVPSSTDSERTVNLKLKLDRLTHMSSMDGEQRFQAMLTIVDTGVKRH